MLEDYDMAATTIIIMIDNLSYCFGLLHVKLYKLHLLTIVTKLRNGLQLYVFILKKEKNVRLHAPTHTHAHIYLIIVGKIRSKTSNMHSKN